MTCAIALRGKTANAFVSGDRYRVAATRVHRYAGNMTLKASLDTTTGVSRGSFPSRIKPVMRTHSATTLNVAVDVARMMPKSKPTLDVNASNAVTAVSRGSKYEHNNPIIFGHAASATQNAANINRLLVTVIACVFDSVPNTRLDTACRSLSSSRSLCSTSSVVSSSSESSEGSLAATAGASRASSTSFPPLSPLSASSSASPSPERAARASSSSSPAVALGVAVVARSTLRVHPRPATTRSRARTTRRSTRASRPPSARAATEASRRSARARVARRVPPRPPRSRASPLTARADADEGAREIILSRALVAAIRSRASRARVDVSRAGRARALDWSDRARTLFDGS